ncbi:MAG: co-chaperone DjlA [Candidatus Schmidhempelia sp.]|nr:co-chaperone DjlA [Candidatus Schmidhempelia sp.]
MSRLWAFVCGVIFMFVFKMGFLGFILGLFVGTLLYKWFDKVAPIGGNLDPTLYLSTTFEVLGHLSKAKGNVTENDIRMATHFMDRLNLTGNARILAQQSFNLGKEKDYPLRQRLKLFYQSYHNQRRLFNVFCEQLIQVALNDGHLHPSEEQILYIVAEELNISRARMAMYIQMIIASRQFQQYGHGYYQQGHYQQYQHSNYGNSYIKEPSIEDAYRVLGVDVAADVTTIKRAYRKLMNEHHPDKLISKGLPKEMLEMAKQRAQEIQAAYDLIKAHRGFK